MFDTGPIISLAMNNLLWLVEPMRNHFGGEFYITPAVYRELIETPLKTKKFKFEAFQILKLINKGLIKVVDSPNVYKDTRKLIELANKIYKSRGNWIKIMHLGEVEAIAAAIHYNSDAFVIDERTTRTLIEDPDRLHKTMKKKLHTQVTVDKANLAEFKSITKDIKMIRSTEMVTMAFELGLLNRYLPNIKNARKQLLESVLWALKLNGAAISQNEIDEMVKLEIT